MGQAKQLHTKALELREQGKFSESIAVNDEALLAATQEGNVGEYAANIACLALTRKVRAGLKKNPWELHLAEGELQAAVNLVKEHGKPEDIAVPLYQLAQIKEDLGKFSEAVATYKEALQHFEQHPPESHNRPSVIADVKVHMTACEYKAGDKIALDRLHKALADLEASDEPDSYAKHVWISGGYMRLATILRTDQPDDARLYLARAKETIDADDRLVVRKQQWEQLAATF